MRKNELYDKIKGALYGVAIGDALGGPLEFMSAEEIQAEHGLVTEMIGGGWLDLNPGETTDDTAMTMCVAYGILENPSIPYQAIGRRFIEWKAGGPKDIGMTCALAIDYAQNRCKNDWWEAAHLAEAQMHGRSDGNGALMRTIYPALYYTDEKKRRLVTRGIALMTHTGKTSAEICEAYVEIVSSAIHGREAAPYSYLTPEGQHEPNGYVVNTYANVMQAITETGSFEEALVNAVNRGGDADTNGAIAGGLAGAIYGYEEIPQRWIDALPEGIKIQLDYFAQIAYEKQTEEE